MSMDPNEVEEPPCDCELMECCGRPECRCTCEEDALDREDEECPQDDDESEEFWEAMEKESRRQHDIWDEYRSEDRQHDTWEEHRGEV